jgi:hypothetical protein
MRNFCGQSQRALQERFNARPIADRLAEVAPQDALSAVASGRAEAAGGCASMEVYMRLVGEGSPEA